MNKQLAILASVTLTVAPNAFAQITPTTDPVQTTLNLASVNGPAHDVSVTPNGLYSITSSNLSTAGVGMVNLTTGALIATHNGPGTHTSGNDTMTRSVLTTDDRAIVVSIAGVVTIYDISGGTLSHLSTHTPTLPGGAKAKDMGITPDGTRAVVAFHNADTLVFDLAAGGAPIATSGVLTSPGSSYGAVPALNALRVTDTHAIAIGSSIKIYDIGAATPSDITPAAVLALSNQTYYDVEVGPSGYRAIVRADNATGADDSHSITMETVSGVQTAAYESAFPNPGSVDIYNGGRLVGLLEDSIVMTDKKAILIGISSLTSGTAQVIDFVVPTPVLNTFTLGGIPHDLEITPQGTRGIVHTSTEVQIYDLATAGSPALLGSPLSSPGKGMLNIYNHSTMVWNVFYMENTIAINAERAIVAGSDYNAFNGTSSSKINVYDLDTGGSSPSLLQSHTNTSGGFHEILHEVAITPAGGMAAVAATFDTSFVDMDSGDLISVIGGPGRISPFTVHSVALSNTRAISIANANLSLVTYQPRYTVNALSQLPYNQGAPLPNTTGSPTLLSGSGSVSIASNSLNLIASGLPTNGSGTSSQGLMFYSFGLDGPTPLNDGLLLIGPALFRVTPNPVPITTDPYVLPLDLTNLPAGGAISAFQEVHFQLWYRDQASPNGANLSDVYTVSFGL